MKGMKPTIATYDLRVGSQVVYGNDYLKKLPQVNPQTIPLREGVILLLNRMAEGLHYFTSEKSHEEHMKIA